MKGTGRRIRIQRAAMHEQTTIERFHLSADLSKGSRHETPTSVKTK
jgi:hypothetical protein